MNLGDWLRNLGLEKYEAAFRDNEIDETVLPNLTAEDLKELGVVALGHRRKLLDAIVALRSDEKTSSDDRRLNFDAASVSGKDHGERRQVTVMFSDLVGSTALSAHMDPEDLHEVISTYQRCVTEIVGRFEGFVAKYMGDGVLIYFGYPQAQEDDAERAVQAGLELVTAVAALQTNTPLQTRVGIATGLVVVGDLIGSGAAQERSIVGATPNLAARLQSLAAPNTVVIAEGTRKLIGNLFTLEDLGAKGLKGIPGSVHAWVAVREAAVESRFEALHAGGLTDLVGRDKELALLMQRWTEATAGDGQMILLSGEAGIGKSRLTAALMERLAAEPHTRLRYFCSPQHADSAFYPIISQMQRAAGFAHDDTVQTKLDKLDVLLRRTATSRKDAALFAEMLSLPNDGRYPALHFSPQQRRLKTLDALGTQMTALAKANPLLMILEDAHWADPSSLEAFGRAVDRLAELRILLIVSHRPEFAQSWNGRPRVTDLTINRLGRHDIDALINRVAGDEALPPNVRQDIIERTDGIPLFVEEMTKAALEAGSDDAAARAVAMAPSPAAAVPASLHTSLMARLDRLGPAKEVAQIGATIGREFSYPLLAAVTRKRQAELDAALDRLVEAGLLFRQGLHPDCTYIFKHALVQDAAYGTLLREPRRALHARIAETVQRQFGEIAAAQPELLARHYAEAAQIEKAASFWGKAGRRSLDRSALVEAIAQLTRSLDHITSLPNTSALRREQINLLVALINPLMHVKGYAAPETKRAAERAHELILQSVAHGEDYTDDPLLLFSALFGLWNAHVVAGNSNAGLELAAQFLTLARKQETSAALLMAHRVMGVSLLYAGKLVESRSHFEQGIALYDPGEHRSLASRFGVDARVSMLSYLAWAMWMLGYPEAALVNAQHALRDARDIGQAGSLMFALGHALVVNAFQNGDAAAAMIQELSTLADEKGAMQWKRNAAMFEAWSLARAGNAVDAVGLFTTAIRAMHAAGADAWMPLYLSAFAQAYSDLGQFEDSWRCISEAMKTTEERWFQAEIQRIAGEMILVAPEPDVMKAEAYFGRALAVARLQQAKSWELRAAMSTARLWRDQGKRQQAHELLAPVYGWFTEGFDTRDLKEAKALLDEISA